jgi:hypothetical protein
MGDEYGGGVEWEGEQRRRYHSQGGITVRTWVKTLILILIGSPTGKPSSSCSTRTSSTP